MRHILFAGVALLMMVGSAEARVSKSTVALMHTWQDAHVDCEDGKGCMDLSKVEAALRARGCLLVGGDYWTCEGHPLDDFQSGAHGTVQWPK